MANGPRLPSDLVGILNVNKERGWTSHDVVARVRRLSGERRVGHAGTLDPLAEGVLPVLIGRATRLADFVGNSGQKRYLANVSLGRATTTDDAEGVTLLQAPVPVLSAERVEPVLDRFGGAIRQVPPAYSAIKVGGQRAYAVARRGDAPELAAREVTIHAIRLVDLGQDWLELDVACSRGTYIRALARDLARAMGTEGHLTALVRTEVGSFSLTDALTLTQIEEVGVQAALKAPDLALPHAPIHTPTGGDLRRLWQGQTVNEPGLADGYVRVYDEETGRMVLVGYVEAGQLRSRIVLRDPIISLASGSSAS